MSKPVDYWIPAPTKPTFTAAGEIPDSHDVPGNLQVFVEDLNDAGTAERSVRDIHEDLTVALGELNKAIVSGTDEDYTEAREDYIRTLKKVARFGGQFAPTIIKPTKVEEVSTGVFGFPSLRVEGPVQSTAVQSGGEFYYSSSNPTCLTGWADRFALARIQNELETLSPEGLATFETEFPNFLKRRKDSED